MPLVGWATSPKPYKSITSCPINRTEDSRVIPNKGPCPGVGEGSFPKGATMLYAYHDCDRVAVFVGLAIICIVMMVVAHIYDKREQFSRYEQRRREYSEWRLCIRKN